MTPGYVMAWIDGSTAPVDKSISSKGEVKDVKYWGFRRGGSRSRQPTGRPRTRRHESLRCQLRVSSPSIVNTTAPPGVVGSTAAPHERQRYNLKRPSVVLTSCTSTPRAAPHRPHCQRR